MLITQQAPGFWIVSPTIQVAGTSSGKSGISSPYQTAVAKAPSSRYMSGGKQSPFSFHATPLLAVPNAAADRHELLRHIVLCNIVAESEEGVWLRSAFYRFLASVGRGLETLLLVEVRQHDTNLVRHLSNVVPLSAPTFLRSACTNREQQILLHVGLSEETATVVELNEALEEGICGTEQGVVGSRLHMHRAVD